MMTRSGSADLPLHYGQVPPWLAQRMTRLGKVITETIVLEYGLPGFLSRLSNPFWFQSLGCVMGMDWHSSGITTSVMGALKKALNPMASELGLYVCGGRGKHSRQTPDELQKLGDQTGLNATDLIRSSRLSAKVDNSAIQDGFQLYLHCFVVARTGEWVVVQQGMNTDSRTARRYHWSSQQLPSFIEEPHTAIYGPNQGAILNLTHSAASATRQGILTVLGTGREEVMQIVASGGLQGQTFGSRVPGGDSWLPDMVVPHLSMPAHHDVKSSDIHIKRLGAVLALAHEKQPMDFESLLLLEGVGPRTVQSLTLVSEVMHGTASRFSDPARFSFAHGGKDGHPFPVPLDVYDQTVSVLEKALSSSKLDREESASALSRLSGLAARLEKDFKEEDRVAEWIAHERAESYKYGGMTVAGPARPAKSFAQGPVGPAKSLAQGPARPPKPSPTQLSLF
jgi:hypothetical protein